MCYRKSTFPFIMKKALLIAEKPSAMKDIRAVYNKMNHPDQIDFTALRGHVVGLVEPDKYKPEWGQPWTDQVLPMVPEKFKYRVLVKEVYDSVIKQIKSGNYTHIINAADAGREGELIFQTVYELSGSKLPVLRYWASDPTDETVKAALLNLIDGNEPAIQLLGHSARYRSYFDWLIGMNMSRATTLSSKESTPVGRVMTPTLALIVRRDLEIQNFKPQKYWEMEATFDGYKGTWFDKDTDEKRITTRDKAVVLWKKLKAAQRGTIESLVKERKPSHAPTLHSLMELQKEAGRAFGYTAAEVLSIAQSLYEDKKILSYPRTESRYLPKNLAAKVPDHLKVLIDLPEVGSVAQQILSDQSRIGKVMSSKKYVDDKKITDHHAILPTTVKPNLASLSEKEKNVYLLVVKRLLSIFMDPYVVDKTTIITNIDQEFFKSTGQIVVELGYRSLYKQNKKKEDEPVLPPLNKGDIVPVNKIEVLTKETTPPKRFDDPDLLTAMANAGNGIEDKDLKNILKETAGLGTSATRAAIIDKLLNMKMVERKGKVLFATEYGIRIIQKLGDRDIVSPELTAKWEMKLRDVEDGKYSPELFYREMIAYIEASTKDLLTNIKATPGATSSGKSTKETIGKCPRCNAGVVIGKNYYLCENYKNPCTFVLDKKPYGVNLTKTDVKALLSGKTTNKKKLKYSSGKTSEEVLGLNKDFRITPGFALK